MKPFSSGRSRDGKIRTSYWRNGLLLLRAGIVAGLLVVVLGLIDQQMLMTPVLEAIGLAAVAFNVFGIFLCISGVTRRSRRLRERNFWPLMVGGLMLTAAVGALYLRAYQSPRDGHPRQEISP